LIDIVASVLVLINLEFNRNHVLTKHHDYINAAAKTGNVKLEKDPAVDSWECPSHNFDFFLPGCNLGLKHVPTTRGQLPDNSICILFEKAFNRGRVTRTLCY